MYPCQHTARKDSASPTWSPTFPAAEPTLRQIKSVCGAKVTCSFDEECRAMWRAVDWLVTNASGIQSAAMFTDSQPLCMALESLNRVWPPSARRSAASRGQPNLFIQWIPSHCNISGNDFADAAVTPMPPLAHPTRWPLAPSRGFLYRVVCTCCDFWPWQFISCYVCCCYFLLFYDVVLIYPWF